MSKRLNNIYFMDCVKMGNILLNYSLYPLPYLDIFEQHVYQILLYGSKYVDLNIILAHSWSNL